MALRHVEPGERVHLASEGTPAGQRTAALVKTDRFEAAQLVIGARDKIARHSVPGYATIQCLEGKVVLETHEPIELTSGDWLYLERGQEHSVEAIEDSSLLLTIMFD
jgi:quercetin dioxygenase-like cupin family protein